jgi:Protein kinase domain
MWSAGCVLYELATGKYAFQGANLRALIANIIRGSFAPVPPQYSPQLKELIVGLLDTNPRRRLSVHQVLAKPIMQRRIQNFLSQTGLQEEFAHTVIHGRPPRGALVVQAPPPPPGAGGLALLPAIGGGGGGAAAAAPAMVAPAAAHRAVLPGVARGAAGAQAAVDAQARRLEEVRVQQVRACERAAEAQAAAEQQWQERRDAQEAAYQRQQAVCSDSTALVYVCCILSSHVSDAAQAAVRSFARSK